MCLQHISVSCSKYDLQIRFGKVIEKNSAGLLHRLGTRALSAIFKKKKTSKRAVGHTK